MPPSRNSSTAGQAGQHFERRSEECVRCSQSSATCANRERENTAGVAQCTHMHCAYHVISVLSVTTPHCACSCTASRCIELYVRCPPLPCSVHRARHVQIDRRSAHTDSRAFKHWRTDDWQALLIECEATIRLLVLLDTCERATISYRLLSPSLLLPQLLLVLKLLDFFAFRREPRLWQQQRQKISAPNRQHTPPRKTSPHMI